ncbi:glycosyltransferase family 2 protein [Metabacillus sp. FJAT-53654]|uniref:Glycosyltransferase family 2 protein n=1 Tax=Metabacillus rhizosphaerae TaxID=3117747 RepID=A0ABZ2MZY7_9BACI
MSKVSVVVPIYNAEKYLEKCIKSILNQTFKDFELILVNDGSIDNSLDICNKYEKQDKRIIVIDKKNEGSIVTRRKGIEAATSKFIMFVDADDWINIQMIQKMYKEIVNHNVDIVVCNMYRVLGKGALIKDKNESWYFKEDKVYEKEEIKKDIATAYLHGHPFPPSLCGKLYKKEVLLSSGKYLNTIQFLGDDLFYNLDMLLKINSLKIIIDPLYYYRLGGFTSKYMPYFFPDVVNGYMIQKEVIENYYSETRKREYNGISIMLLNMLRSSMYNLFNSNLNNIIIKETISEYLTNECIIECLSNEGVIKYFTKEYLEAIENKDVEYFYNIGYTWSKKRKPKKILMNAISKIGII